MATIDYDVAKPLALKVALAASKLQEALADFHRVAGLALASASAAGNAATDSTWAVIEGAGSEYGVVAAGGSPGVKGHAWFTAVDTLQALAANSSVKDALEKLDKGA